MRPTTEEPRDVLEFTKGQLDILNVFFYYNQGNLVLPQEVTEALGETFADMGNRIERVKEMIQ